ncbi:phosphatidate cytidylyltransferase [Lutispora saccharofermentans]|uniref:Phosphatidate cytidylyltransferase n=1 Tax=Lutispora saccharofermentans TaxID=3024236 RepID=A0ABT1N9P7_9FIRM|nr:phosphatidate cytidylyltransferase [Lutispora saccharofermentans]MCQ1527962.1 phosphatidate cytidylyltransferase [Lutispora saccharofermentans]
MLKTRIISAVIGLPLMISTLIIGGKFFYLFVFLLSAVGLYEYYRAFSNTDYKPTPWIGYSVTIMYYFLISISYNSFITLSILIFIALLLTFLDTIKKGYNILNVAVTVLGVIYVSYLFSNLIFIYNKTSGNILVWLPFLTAWFSDTGAYFIGSCFGKNKLCPSVSPKKTIEGAVGGIIGSAAISTLAGFIFIRMGYQINIIHYLFIGLLCGITSILGDLSASSIKRFCKIKDFGNIIPGHGGVLDRFDSILFTAPTVYTYITIMKELL